MTAELSEIEVEKNDNNNNNSIPHPSHYKKWFELLEKIDLRRHLSEVELILIEGALKKSNGSVTEASKSLKINRTTLIEKMKKYSIPKLGSD
jgi:sigma-54 specific flagellar transcriptional regulator A